MIGTVHIPVLKVLETPTLSSHGLYDLESPKHGQQSDVSLAKIRLSVCYRFIHRPRSRGYITRHSLKDLSKIYHNHPTKENDIEGETLLLPTLV